VVCDLSEFSGAKSIRQIIFYLTSDKGIPLNGTHFAVSEINAFSLKYDSAFLEEKFRQERDKFLSFGQPDIHDRLPWILIGVMVSAATIEILYILSRVRTKPQTEEKTDISEDLLSLRKK